MFWPTEARRVRAQVEAAAAALTSPPGEPDMPRLVRLAGLARRLAPDVVVEPEPGGPQVRGRETVAGLAAQLSGMGGIRQVAVRDIVVVIDDTRTTARVSAVVDLVRAAAAQPRPEDAEPVTIELRKVGGDWLITRAAREPTLTR
jgi:hypothetical protein